MLKLWRGCLTVFLKFIKNNKGQGLVEFALVCAFCVAVGLAAREAGLLDALSDSYNEQQTAFAPSDIQPYKSNVAGNISAGTNVSGGGGTNTGGESGNTGGQGEGTGGQSGNTGGQGEGTGGQGEGTGGQGEGTGGQSGNTGDQGGNTPGIVPGGNGEGEVDPEEQGGESQNTGPTAVSEEAIANRILAVYEDYKGKNPNGAWGDYADVANALKTEGINVDTNTINALVSNGNAWKTNAGVAYGLKKSVNGRFDDNDKAIHDFLDTYIKTYGSDNAANNLRATNSYFANMEDWRINQMISDLGSNKLTSENVYYGYISIKQKFWSENKSVSLAINPETQTTGMLPVSNNNIYGLNSIDLTNWNITTISEKNSVINKGVMLNYNDTFYIYNSDDKSNLDKFVNEFLTLGRTVQLTGSIVDHYDTVDNGSWTENKYPQLNYGDIVITENGDKYLILNGGSWYNPSNITSGNLKIN